MQSVPAVVPVEHVPVNVGYALAAVAVQLPTAVDVGIINPG